MTSKITLRHLFEMLTHRSLSLFLIALSKSDRTLTSRGAGFGSGTSSTGALSRSEVLYEHRKRKDRLKNSEFLLRFIIVNVVRCCQKCIKEIIDD